MGLLHFDSTDVTLLPRVAVLDNRQHLGDPSEDTTIGNIVFR